MILMQELMMTKQVKSITCWMTWFTIMILQLIHSVH
ncbi:hypothetical protein OROMI_031713 [Orobanche minor]